MKNEQLKTALISALTVIVLLLLVLRKVPITEVNNFDNQIEETAKVSEEETVSPDVITSDVNPCMDSEETIDSLQTLLKNYEEKIPEEDKLTRDERKLQETIIELNKGYAKMSQTKDIQEVLKHFLPKFSSNIINIGVDETVFVDRRGSKAYGNRLEDLIQMNGLEIIMGSTKFLHLFIKGDVAIAIYLTQYETKIDGKTIIEGTVLGKATCKRNNDKEYKIGNYSLVNVRDYEIFTTSK